MQTITEYLIERYGFEKYQNYDVEKLDINKWSCYQRIHIAHVLFYSERLGHFTLAYRYDHPRGLPAGGKEELRDVTIPVVMKDKKRVDELMKGFGLRKFNKDGTIGKNRKSRTSIRQAKPKQGNSQCCDVVHSKGDKRSN